MFARCRLLLLIALLAGVSPLWTLPDEARAVLRFTKVFPGGAPDFVEVSVDETGAATYRGRADEDAELQKFQLSPQATQRLFSLAAALNHFQGIEVESPHKVAFMGEKTFAYTKDGRESSIRFNYTEDPTALGLQEVFEAIGRGRYYCEQLESRLRYDRLGIIEVMRNFERDFNAGKLTDVQQFAPLLEQIANDPSLARLARSRAADLLRRVRGGPARLELELVEKRSGLFYRLVVEEPGQAFYESRRIGEQPDPQPWRLSETAIARLLELVQLANYLRNAPMSSEAEQAPGVYRLTYDSGAEKNNMVFVTAPSAPVAEMIHIFRQILQQEYFGERLTKAERGEGEMLLIVLQELDAAVQRDNLVAPKEFVPRLEAIAGAEATDPVTRQQAEQLLARLRATAR
ncbi:MAG: hypothetical protein L0212_01615 [Acidobacteria bacterium]|nr:hypothetical protein [Acidobacteriota bacterium]